MHHYQDLITLFEETFFVDFKTKLVKGEDEPLYLPANDVYPYHQIIFAHGFFTSALHEISHWCIAGKKRRQQIDYGYWYAPDGRTEKQQQAFEELEKRPQALDWLFCLATQHSFNVSCDNLEGTFAPDRQAFLEKVYKEVMEMLEKKTIPPRALKFLRVLTNYYGTTPQEIEAQLHSMVL